MRTKKSELEIRVTAVGKKKPVFMVVKGLPKKLDIVPLQKGDYEAGLLYKDERLYGFYSYC